MTALGDLYETINGKQVSYLVTVGGQAVPGVQAVEYGAQMGQAATASFIIPNPLPAYITYDAPVSIYTGYNGLLALRFTGAVRNPTPSAQNVMVECVGEGRKLRVPYQRHVKTIAGEDASAVVTQLLQDAGVTNFGVNLPPWTIGAAVTAELDFQIFGDAVNTVAIVDGSPWYELPSGQIRVEVKDPWPAPTFFRQYYAGQLSQLTDSEREQLADGTLPISAIQPAAVTNPNLQPRVRFGLKQTALIENVKNRVFVEGAMLTVVNPDGSASSERIEAVAQAASPWITTPPQFQDLSLDFFLIDTQDKADLVAYRQELLNNRLVTPVALQVDGDPEIFLGMTVGVEDPDHTGVTGNWFVYGYRGRLSKNDYVTELDLRGGIASGTTPLLAPVADFVFANEQGIGKVSQVTPSGGSIIVQFDGRLSHDPDGTIANYAWSDDQGNSASGADKSVVQFGYDESVSTVAMTLTVTDNDGLTDAITKSVAIAGSSGSCGDSAMAILAAAIKTHMSASADGGKTWLDMTKVTAAVTGDFVRCCINNTARQVPNPLIPSGTLGPPPDKPVMMFGTSNGEVVITDDFCATRRITATIAAGHAITFIVNGGFSVNREWSGLEDWLIGTDDGRIFMLLGFRNSAAANFGTYSITSFNFNDGFPAQDMAFLSNFVRLASGSHAFGWLVASGDTADPTSLLHVVTTAAVPLQPVNQGIVTINGALLAAIQAAGGGHKIVSVAPFPVSFERIACAIMFDTGVSPRVWWTPSLNFDEIDWQPATGLPDIAGVDLAKGLASFAAANGQDWTDYPGFSLGQVVAVLAQTKTFRASDGVAYTEGSIGSPSQIARATWEGPVGSLYIAAAAAGLVKSLDQGDSWGYIRPHAGLGIAWPVGAEGHDVAFYGQPPPPCANIFTLAVDIADGSKRSLLQLAGPEWKAVAAGEPQHSFGLKYFGGGHFLHLVEDAVPRISTNYGVTWVDAAAPDGTHLYCHDVAMDSAGERLWGLWRATGGSPPSVAVCYSLNFGATWIVAYTEAAYMFTIATHPSDPTRIAIGGASGLNFKLWTSTNRGVAFTSHTGPLGVLNLIWPEAGITQGSTWLQWTPYGRIIAITSQTGDIYYTDDLGVTFVQSTTPGWLASAPLQLLRAGGFGPFWALAMNNHLIRSDDLGVSFVAATMPPSNRSGLIYDPLIDTLVAQSTSGTEEVAALAPAATGAAWQDWSFNFGSVAGIAQINQPLAFIHDPAAVA